MKRKLILLFFLLFLSLKVNCISELITVEDEFNEIRANTPYFADEYFYINQADSTEISIFFENKNEITELILKLLRTGRITKAVLIDNGVLKQIGKERFSLIRYENRAGFYLKPEVQFDEHGLDCTQLQFKQAKQSIESRGVFQKKAANKAALIFSVDYKGKKKELIIGSYSIGGINRERAPFSTTSIRSSLTEKTENNLSGICFRHEYQAWNHCFFYSGRMFYFNPDSLGRINRVYSDAEKGYQTGIINQYGHILEYSLGENKIGLRQLLKSYPYRFNNEKWNRDNYTIAVYWKKKYKACETDLELINAEGVYGWQGIINYYNRLINHSLLFYKTQGVSARDNNTSGLMQNTEEIEYSINFIVKDIRIDFGTKRELRCRIDTLITDLKRREYFLQTESLIEKLPFTIKYRNADYEFLRGRLISLKNQDRIIFQADLNDKDKIENKFTAEIIREKEAGYSMKKTFLIQNSFKAKYENCELMLRNGVYNSSRLTLIKEESDDVTGRYKELNGNGRFHRLNLIFKLNRHLRISQEFEYQRDRKKEYLLNISCEYRL